MSMFQTFQNCKCLNDLRFLAFDLSALTIWFVTICDFLIGSLCKRGVSGGAMVLGNFPVPGSPTIWMIVGQGHIALSVVAGGVV